MPSSPRGLPSGNDQGIPSDGPSYMPQVEATAAVAYAQAMPREFPSVFHSSPVVASCHDALMAALLTWKRTLDTAQCANANGGATEGKSEDLHGARGPREDGVLDGAFALMEHKELQRLRAAYEAGTMNTVLGSIATTAGMTGGEDFLQAQKGLTAERMRWIRAQVDDAERKVKEAKARKEATLSRLNELFEKDIVNIVLSKVQKKHLRKPRAGPPSGKMELEIYDAFMDVTKAEAALPSLKVQLAGAEAIWNNPWRTALRLESYCDELWDTAASLAQAPDGGARR